jgi:Putative zinc-finger
MACEDFQVELSAWVDGESTGSERARLTAHLQTCRECAATLGALQNTSSLLRALAIPRAPASITQPAIRQARAMRNALTAPRVLRVRASHAALGLAAAGLAAAIAVVIFFGWHGFANGPSAPANPVSAGAVGPATSGSYRLSSAQDDAALGTAPTQSGYDFRDPNTHGQRDIGTFDARERFAWEHGVWHHEQRFGRDGWWWEVGGAWYWYERPTAGPPPYVSELRFAADLASRGQNPKNPVAAEAPQRRQ